MIDLKFDLKPLAQIEKKISLTDFRLVYETSKAIKLGAQVIRNTAVRKIHKGGRTGTTYKRRTIRHQASAPGEPPKSDTGRLVSSFRVDSYIMRADFGSDLKYAAWLEDGTKNKDGTVRMAARPWLDASYQESKQEIEKLVMDALAKHFKK